VFGKELSDDELKSLVEHGRTALIKGFKKRDGSGTYDARLVVGREFKTSLDFDKGPKGPEPEPQPVGAATAHL
jgi:hypothetical protein